MCSLKAKPTLWVHSRNLDSEIWVGILKATITSKTHFSQTVSSEKPGFLYLILQNQHLRAGSHDQPITILKQASEHFFSTGTHYIVFYSTLDN